MKRNTTAAALPEEAAFVTPAQRVWIERSRRFRDDSEEVEDWSFLKRFTETTNAGQEESSEQQYWSDNPEQ